MEKIENKDWECPECKSVGVPEKEKIHNEDDTEGLTNNYYFAYVCTNCGHEFGEVEELDKEVKD